MNPVIFAFFCVVILALCIRPFGLYMARVYMGEGGFLQRHLGGLERFIYRLCGINPHQETGWQGYLGAVLLLGALSVGLLMAIFMGQGALPLNPQAFPGLPIDTAFNAAVAFTTNTDWQSYSGESALSYFSQMFACTVQNFLSAATGMAVAVAMFRGLARKQAHFIGNAYVDVVRGTLYILLPVALLFALLLAALGVIQNFSPYTAYTSLEGVQHLIPQGPVASMESIKLLGGNGGGFFNANSAHPFENPTATTNLLELILMLIIPVSLPYTFGIMVGDTRQCWMLLGAMTALFIPLTAMSIYSERLPSPYLEAGIVDPHGGNMEGKEMRFGAETSAMFGMVTATTAAGAVNAMHDSFMPLSGFSAMLFMQLGEVIYGGIGSGMYGILMFTMLTVFMGGLMVGRTPEYLGKKLTTTDVKLASMVMLVPTTLVLVGTAIGVSVPEAQGATLNKGAHGFSEILYAFSSAVNNNGSAFAGFNAATPFWNTLLAIFMLLGRYGVIAPVLMAAGALAAKNTVPHSAGTLPTHTPMFAGLLVGIVVLIGALNYIPALALGPVVEHVQLMQARSAK